MAVKQAISIHDDQQIEDWDAELKEEQQPPGRLVWKGGEYVFTFFHEDEREMELLKKEEDFCIPVYRVTV